ncbi:MAG: M23 family metallopeptidase, partial [Nanoarchaeota archaeon]
MNINYKELESTLIEVKKHSELFEKADIKELYKHWNNLNYSIQQLFKKIGFKTTESILIWPMIGRISAPYNERRARADGTPYYHTGLDIADNPANKTEIKAAAEGTVARSSLYGGYGLCVDIKHTNSLATRYAHCSVLKVKVGERVKQGQIIAIVGSTGHSTGPH